jgi:EF-P beta-lysylation protein EpmB
MRDLPKTEFVPITREKEMGAGVGSSVGLRRHTVESSTGTGASNWQREMQTAFRALPALLDYLELDPATAPEALLADPDFPLLVPRNYAARMRKGDWRDPLLLQVLPRSRERDTLPGFLNDAVGDAPAQIVPGLLHKYKSRALLMVSPNCAVHCRYCFRREYPYANLPRTRESWETAWAYLEANPDIDEVILSGGDPLSLDNRRLAGFLERAASIPRIATLRMHTRWLIVLPSRVDAGFLELAGEISRKKTFIVVVHANHPDELTGDCPAALKAIRSQGALLLNQSVLLKGVNDDGATLAELSRRLLRSGVLPYYLHQLDRVTGAGHFEMEESRGLELMAILRRKLPGYLVPQYVREIAGQESKLPVTTKDSSGLFPVSGQ